MNLNIFSLIYKKLKLVFWYLKHMGYILGRVAQPAGALEPGCEEMERE